MNRAFQCLGHRQLLAAPLTSPIRALANLNTSGVQPFDRVPSLPNIPYLGSIHHYIPALGGHDHTKIHEISEKRYHQFGPIYKEDLRLVAGKFGVWLYNPDDIEKVYRSGGKFPVRGGFDSLGVYRRQRADVYKSLGLMLLNGQEWQSFRSKVQPVLLQPKVMSNYSSSVSSIADGMIGEIRKHRNQSTHEIVDFLSELYRFTLESVAFLGLDKRLNCLSNYGPSQRELVATVKEMFHLEAKLNDNFIWKIIGKPYGTNWARFFQLNDNFTSMVFGYVKEKMAQLAASSGNLDNGDKSVLEHFLSRPNCVPEDAVTMVMDLFFAGIDTTAHLIAFSLHYLANHPDIQDRVYQEIDSISGGSGNLDFDQLAQLSLLKACIKEALRISPVTPLSMRINQEPMVLSNYTIPTQSFLILNHYTLGRHPDYFEDPLKFNPDRWIRENRNDSKKIHPFIVLPFGHGPRMCIGRRIAELEALTLLSKIVYHFKTKAKSSDLPTSFMVISYPDNPMTFTFKDRQTI